MLYNRPIGRVEPHIYAFTTGTVPNYLKVGETYRPVTVRIGEWSRIYKNLEYIKSWSACIDAETIFRDHAVHKYLINIGRSQVKRSDFPNVEYLSKEFFKEATKNDVDNAINDIHKSASCRDGRYPLCTPEHLPIVPHFIRDKDYKPRKLQEEVIKKFKAAKDKGQKNLLMYAVMRFGKTFTSLYCAKVIGAKRVLVLCGIKDVKREWQQNVEEPICFEGFKFATIQNLQSSNTFIADTVNAGETVVLFLTLQDLKDKEIKKFHKEVFNTYWDLVIVDETHFGAHADVYGAVLNQDKYSKAEEQLQLHDTPTLDELDKVTQKLKRNVTLHLTGTPYRLLLKDSEFNNENTIAKIQLSDIAEAKAKWEEENRYNENVSDWDNPYYGFPEMLRFAFYPNQSSLDKIKELEKKGGKVAISRLFKCQSKSPNIFEHKEVVLDFLKVIDGSKNDSNVLGFLDHPRLKEGKMCRHIVMVLPWCNSCDAMQLLLSEHKNDFKNLKDYEIINISSATISNRPKTSEEIIKRIEHFESKGIKTITLTAKRMLTGSTVPQWDTMIYLKSGRSAIDYDQAIFRLQSSYIKDYVDKDGKGVKFNMKPTTLLVDFDPTRLFELQEQRCLINNIVDDLKGNTKLQESIQRNLQISPIITLDHNKLQEVTAKDVMEEIRRYSTTRSVIDETSDLSFDSSLLSDSDFSNTISTMSPIGVKKSLRFDPYNRAPGDSNSKETEPTIHDDNPDQEESGSEAPTSKSNTTKDTSQIIEKKYLTYFSHILFFAFLTNDRVSSLEEITAVISKEDNKRIAFHLGLSKNILTYIITNYNPFALHRLDDKIKKLNDLIHDSNLTTEEKITTAFNKFGRMSDSEVVTPQWVADELVNALPENVANGKILDIASKQGEFATALIRRFGNEIKSKLFALCTSTIAYEFTRKIYQLLDIPFENILNIRDFNTYDLINPHKKDSLISLLKEMNIQTIIGNPPYHEDTINTSDKPIYHRIMDASYETSPIVSVITPARYLFNAGKTPNIWNKERLNDNHFKVVKYHANSESVFPNADVKGGVAISIRDEGANWSPIIEYTAYPELNVILSKVSSFGESSITEIIYPQNKFNLKHLFEEYPEIKTKIGSEGREKRLTTSIFSLSEIFAQEEPLKTNQNRIKILGLVDNKRTWRWIDETLLEEHPNTNLWKVILPKSNGSGAIGEVLSTPLVGEPLVGVTQSFITFGAFSSESNAEACLKYLKTKFARTLLGILKVTQDNSKETWKHVPMQDFTTNKDIDWSKSVEDIDKQLYNKYHLEQPEIDFIESMVKPM